MPFKDHPTPIVGVGASAGGVEALQGFFSGMPREPGLGIVVVTHLNPQRESVLHEIVARFTTMPVLVAADGVRVERDHVYVLPADAILTLTGDRLHIRKPGPLQRQRKPIDVFLSSLAENLGESAAAVILSGGDGDGTLGAKAVKERGGLTLAQVQDGHGPTHPDMPETAIVTGFIDFAVPASEMGAKLAEFVRSLDHLDPLSDTAGDADGGEDDLDDLRLEICAILRNQLGHDFAGYKPKTFLRRVQRRMLVAQLTTIEAYLDRLRADATEVAALFRDLLINVTNFFRDADAFDKLGSTVIPKLFEGRGAEDAIRVWVPGCATGEEVFSIAILLREHMDTLSALPKVQVFATLRDHVHPGRAGDRDAAGRLDLHPRTDNRHRVYAEPGEDRISRRERLVDAVQRAGSLLPRALHDARCRQTKWDAGRVLVEEHRTRNALAASDDRHWVPFEHVYEPRDAHPVSAHHLSPDLKTHSVLLRPPRGWPCLCWWPSIHRKA